MGPEPIDYELVLADLEAKRAALDAAISALRQALSTGTQVALGVATPLGGKPLTPSDIPDDAFFGLSILEATKKYLHLVKKKQSLKEIADGLDRGGLPHTSSNFVNTVATMLSRAKDDDLARVGRGEWGLSAWYGNRRPRIDVPTKPRQDNRARRKEKQLPSSKKIKPSASGSTSLSVAEQATQVLKDQGGPLRIKEIQKKIQERYKRAVPLNALSARLDEKVKLGVLFSKPEPATYALL